MGKASYERVEVKSCADLQAALIGLEGAQAGWDRLPDSAKKAALWWVKSAKRSATRARRIQASAEACSRSERPR